MNRSSGRRVPVRFLTLRHRAEFYRLPMVAGRCGGGELNFGLDSCDELANVWPPIPTTLASPTPQTLRT